MKSRAATADHPHEKPHHPHWPLAALLFAFVFALGMGSVHDPAAWVRVKAGAKILADGALPKTDPFSYGSAGASWTTHSWLSDALFAKLDALGGPRLLAAAKSAALAGAFALLLPINHGSPMVAASLLSAGACAAWAGFAETPLVFDLLFFSLFVRLLRPRRRFQGTDAAAAAGLTALWSNLHGASAPLALWFVGLKTLKTTMRTAARERAGYWAMLLACVLTFSWNPHGWRVLLAWFSDAASGEQHWRTVLFSPAGVFLAAGAGACWFTLQQEFVTTLIAATAISLALVLPGLRPLGVLAACPVIALALGHALKPRQDTWPRVLRWAAFSAGLLAMYHAAVTERLAPSAGYGAPALTGTVNFLNTSGVRGRMFNEPALGAELIGLSGRPVFIDRRPGLYPDSFRREAEDWPHLFPALDGIYGFDYAVVANRRAPAPARVLDESRGWRLAYADDRALVYLKTDGANAWLAPQSSFKTLTPNRLWPDALDAALAVPRQAPRVLEELDRWTVASPDCAQALLWKAYALSRLKMGDKADRLLAVAAERPGLAWDPELQAAQAFVLAERGRADESRVMFRRAERSARALGDAALAAAIAERAPRPVPAAR
ncbi:MAG: hypothetical protein HY079_12470 [Elusimicrobia bacterium]|nr:hypothetical protein [Elusimicrobiota bacterium]